MDNARKRNGPGPEQKQARLIGDGSEWRYEIKDIVAEKRYIPERETGNMVPSYDYKAVAFVSGDTENAPVKALTFFAHSDVDTPAFRLGDWYTLTLTKTNKKRNDDDDNERTNW